MKVQFKKCHEDAIIPKYVHSTDSGMDIFAIDNHSLYSSNTVKVRTGLQMILPEGFEAQIRPKSGLSLQGLHVHLGTIDNGYEGEIMVNTCCLNNREYVIKKGEKIAQIVIQKIEQFEVEEIFEIENKSTRGSGGFGSTGLNSGISFRDEGK